MGFIVFILSLTQGRFLVSSCELDVFSDTIYSYFNDPIKPLSLVLAYPSNNLEDVRYHTLIYMKKYGFSKIISQYKVLLSELETIDIACCRCCRKSHQTKNCRSHTHQNNNFILLKCYICNNPHPPSTKCINLTHGKELSYKIIPPKYYTIMPVIEEEEKDTESDYVFVNSNEVENDFLAELKTKKKKTNIFEKLFNYIF